MTEGVVIALIMSGGALIGSVINGVMIYRARKLSNNPFPCKEHGERLKAMDNKLDGACERISRIEGKMNGMR